MASAFDELPTLAQPPVSAAPPPAAPASYRAFGDAPATRRAIYDNVLQAARGLEPISNDRHTLALTDVDYDGPEDYSKADLKRAVLRGEALGRKLKGSWVLTDNTSGATLAHKRSTLAQVPYLADHGAFVQGGSQYTMAHQMRLRPGVFTRIKQNDELESHINVLPGKGRSTRVSLDPATGVFQLQVGQAHMPLVPLLRAMGASDRILREHWGNELALVNLQKTNPQVLNKLYQTLVRTKAPDADPVSRQNAVVAAFEKMELDPEVTQRTLGSPYDRVNLDVLLGTTKKLMQVHRGEVDPDDRDHLAYQTLMGPEELIAERLKRDKGIRQKLLWRATAKGTLDHVPAGAFNPAINAALMSSGLASPLEEINPAEIFDQQTRVTRMGEGGIPTLDAIPDESRSVQPSHLGYIDFLRTPESGKVGVDLRFAAGARKGADGRLYTPVRDLKTGQLVHKTPQDLADATLVFPGELKTNQPMIRALEGGKLNYVPRDKVDYELPAMDHALSPLANMIPAKFMVKGQRAVMASRMLTQALPLTDGESPLVQAAMPDDHARSYEEEYATHMGAVRADDDVEVLSVDSGKVTVRARDGTRKDVELYNNFPFNRKTFWHQTAAVKPGDHVPKGGLLARSNYTDPQGVTALGKNARVAYIPFRGLNYEDATVISQSMAQRLSSEHMYQHDAEWDPLVKRGRNAFLSIFPSKYNRQTMENFDDDGAVKPGTEVKFGDPLVLLAKERERTYGQVHRARKPSFSDETITWEHHAPGTVTDVEKTDKGVAVVVKATAVMQVGDKMSGRYGDKGVVSAIVPDDEMPTDKNGLPFEVLLNPQGIHTRTNPAQIIEGALGRIAAQTGTPYKLADFDTEKDLLEFALKELRDHDLSPKEDLIDAETGRKIPGVFTGNRFFMKLHHTSESKGQGRGTAAYTADGMPAKGGATGAKRVGMLDLGALLSHGATDVISDVKLVRGQANPQHWSQVMSGFNPPPPKVPVVYNKFVNMLRASAINPVRQGTQTHIMAMRDSDIDELAGDREIQNTETVDWKGGLKPKRGGLFDETLTGGHGGNRWAKITLHEPMPSPVMEEPIRRVLGLTENKMREVLAGREKLNGRSGPAAIQHALGQINVGREIDQARLEIKSAKKTARDQAIRRLGYLKDAQRLEIHPKDWMLSKVPVIPPAFRVISQLGPKKLPLVADANYLYKEIFDANRNLKEMQGVVDDVGDERLALYDAFKAVVGLGDPIHPKNVERNVKGMLKQIFGSSPKFGMVQRRLLSTTTDLVGRAAITPNPDLDMDHVGLPEKKAWEVYRPFVIQDLVRRGMGRIPAAQAVKDQRPEAREALVRQLESRPVIINRAPVLHRYGMMAAWPRLVKGDTMQVSPLVVGGFNADFDGDAMQYHVPSTEAAAKEAAEKMLPSKNLFSAANFKVHYKPTNEFQGGLYTASARVDKKAKPRTFQTTKDALQAYYRGEIGVDQQLNVLEP